MEPGSQPVNAGLTFDERFTLYVICHTKLLDTFMLEPATCAMLCAKGLIHPTAGGRWLSTPQGLLALENNFPTLR
jgi:hypothetical protein